MRVLDGLTKALGVLILLGVLLSWPLVSVAHRAFRTIYDAPTLAQAIETYWVGPDALVPMGKFYVHQQVQRTPSNDSTLVVWRALDSLDEAQWHTLLSYIVPKQAVHTVIAQSADAFIQWLQNPDAPPEVDVVLTPWKQAVQPNVAPMVSWLMNQFGECTVLETARWAEAEVRDDWTLPPLCVPLGAPRQTLVQAMTAAVVNEIRATPNKVNLLNAGEGSAADFEAAKRDLWRARRAVNFALIAVVVLWLLGVLLVGRSLEGWLGAAGVTLLLGGFSVAVLGLTSQPVTAAVMGQAGAEVPSWARGALEGTVAFYVSRTLHPLLSWGGGMAVVGGMALLAALLLTSRRRQEMKVEQPR